MYWKSQPVFSTSNTELKFELSLWVKTILNLGSEYPMERSNMWVDSNQNNTEIPADPQEDQVPQTSVKVVAARSKAKSKPQQREPVDTTTTIPMHERRWIDIEPSNQNLASYDLPEESRQSSSTQSNVTARR